MKEQCCWCSGSAFQQELVTGPLNNNQNETQRWVAGNEGKEGGVYGYRDAGVDGWRGDDEGMTGGRDVGMEGCG